MRTNLRWLKLGVLGLALAAKPAPAQDPQYEPDQSHQNSALLLSYDLARSDSAMQSSASAHQNTTEEMLRQVARQTSPAHEYGWNAASTICIIALIVCLIGLVTVLRRPETRGLGRSELRRVA